MTIRVACIGGGPGGLFFASQIKKNIPAAEVVLFERNRASDVFGFGVVFSDATLRHIDAADPVLRDGLRDFGAHWDNIEVWLKGAKQVFAGNGMSAIHRRVLLELLQNRAAEVGVDMRFREVVTNIGNLKDFDLVVGADGLNSLTRQQIIADLGHRAETATAKFIWFATTFAFPGLTFVHRRNEHGNFAVHGYPIGDGLSTFIVETDKDTWQRAGLDEFDVTQPPGPSDLKSQHYLEKLFAEDIDGAPLVANNSRWSNFCTRSTQIWHAGNVVLLGDAVHTAHFSVGSGTKMAMEDSIVLAREIAAHPDDLSLAMTNYESERQPKVAKIQKAARPSLSWWEHFGRYYQSFEPSQFAFHFFSRSIPMDKIRLRDPAFAANVERDWYGRHGADVLASSLDVGKTHLASRRLDLLPRAEGWVLRERSGVSSIEVVAHPGDLTTQNALLVEAPHSEAELPAVLSALPRKGGAAAVVIEGGTALTRALISEEARLGRGLKTVIVGGDENTAHTLVLSGRCDAVVLAEESADV